MNNNPNPLTAEQREALREKLRKAYNLCHDCKEFRNPHGHFMDALHFSVSCGETEAEPFSTSVAELAQLALQPAPLSETEAAFLKVGREFMDDYKVLAGGKVDAMTYHRETAGSTSDAARECIALMQTEAPAVPEEAPNDTENDREWLARYLRDTDYVISSDGDELRFREKGASALAIFNRGQVADMLEAAAAAPETPEPQLSAEQEAAIELGRLFDSAVTDCKENGCVLTNSLGHVWNISDELADSVKEYRALQSEPAPAAPEETEQPSTPVRLTPGENAALEPDTPAVVETPAPALVVDERRADLPRRRLEVPWQPQPSWNARSS